jgi:hypothetical protein
MSMRKHRARIHPIDERRFIDKSARPHPPTPLSVLNLEEGLPEVREARSRLQRGLDAFRRQGKRIVKVVHGYGSTGVGGRLREALRGSLFQRKREGAIRDFIPGEDFHDFNPLALQWVERCPVLARDYDYDRLNRGVTIILL